MHPSQQIGANLELGFLEILWTATKVWGSVLPAFVAFWLGLAMKYIKKIIANITLGMHLWWYKKGYMQQVDPNLAASREPFAKILQEKGVELRDVIHALLAKLLPARHSEEKSISWGYWLYLAAFTGVASFLSIGMVIAGVYSARISTSGPTILLSQKCGVWRFDETKGGSEGATRAGIHLLKKEVRAGDYAKNCYGPPNAFEDVQCDFLYRRQLPHPTSPEYSYTCPFKGDVCKPKAQVVTFDTELLDASELGINAKKPPKFRRKTTCVPLNMEFPFIRNTTNNGTTSYTYHYGQKNHDGIRTEYTYNTTGDPFDRLVPVYDVL
jgi:hypothetical protein